MMVHFCTVPGCSNRSDREMQLSFHRLPRDKKVLKQWVHKIGRAQIAISESTRVCSEHFVNSRGRKLVLVRLRLGLFEQDLAYRFGVSQSTISRIIITWIILSTYN